MRYTLFSLLILIFSIYKANASSQPQRPLYKLKDLEALESEQEFKEFFAHAKDVLPSKRTKIWKNMVRSMAMQMLAPMKKLAKSLSAEDYTFILEISNWPVLKENEFYIKQRDEVLVNHFANCFKNNEYIDCYNTALEFTNKYPTSPEFSFNLISHIQKTTPTAKQHYFASEQLGLWPLVQKLVKNELSEFYCKREPLKQTIEQKFFTLAFKNISFNVSDYIHKDCWKAMKSDFKKTLLSSNDPYLRKKTYTVLENNISLNKEEVYTFTLLQMLSGIKLTNDDTITFWNRLEKLSKNYKLRNKLLSHLKSRIPLAGDVFLGATKQQKLITKAINQYFPDYIDFYSTTCLEHLQGIKETVGGNPATKCHELFELSGALKLLPAGKQSQYTKMMSY